MMSTARIPKPKFGWSERVAKEFAEREEKIALAPQPEHTFIAPPGFDAPQIDSTYRQNAMDEYPLCNTDDVNKLIADNRPHSDWVAWAKAHMEQVIGYRSVRPNNRYDSEGNLRFGVFAV